MYQCSVSKIWQTNKFSFFFSISSPVLKKRCYLKINLNPNQTIFSLVDKRSSVVSAAVLPLNILRKKLTYFSIIAILENKCTHCFWILCKSYIDSSSWYLKICNKGVTELSLISAGGQSLFRYSRKGTYTHVRKIVDELPSLVERHYVDILPIMLKKKIDVDGYRVNDVDRRTVQQEISAYQIESTKRLVRKLKTLTAALNKTKKTMPSTQELSAANEKAELLKRYIYLVTVGSKELFLSKVQTGLDHDVSISLKPELSAGQNLDAYYLKFQKKQKTLSLNSVRLNKISLQLLQLEKDIFSMRKQYLTELEIIKILKNHGLSENKTITFKRHDKKEQTIYYRKFVGQYQEIYLVGKNSDANDRLVKLAKSNDYWFHTVEKSGSHVIIPASSIKKVGLLSQIKKQAGILALHYSKKRRQFSGDVYFTQKLSLKKHKGAPSGEWDVKKADSFFVCYTEDELKKILMYNIT